MKGCIKVQSPVLKDLWSGMRFGMILQLAVGPMCLLVFNTASSAGIAAGMATVFAIASVDAAYIALAAFGVSAAMRRASVRNAVSIVGAAVLIAFGVDTILGTLGMSFLPAVSLFSGGSAGGFFAKGALLTASNPLTIIFWGGVFATKASEGGMAGSRLASFGAGCVASTLIFLSSVALASSFAGSFLPESVMRMLNGAVGAVLIYFGIRLFLRRPRQ